MVSGTHTIRICLGILVGVVCGYRVPLLGVPENPTEFRSWQMAFSRLKNEEFGTIRPQRFTNRREMLKKLDMHMNRPRPGKGFWKAQMKKKKRIQYYTSQHVCCFVFLVA